MRTPPLPVTRTNVYEQVTR